MEKTKTKKEKTEVVEPKKESQLQIIGREINAELEDKDVRTALLKTTFKGLDEVNMKKAIFEGMMRGFNFKNFLEKDVYAIPFKDAYSLVTSIDYARKVGMRSGVVGKSAPVWKEGPNGIISCTITIKRQVKDHIGDYSAEVFFSEYDTGRNLWVHKPRTMLAKVAEMHALRMACPEEMAQIYVEEEFEKEKEVLPAESKVEDYRAKMMATTNLEELKKVFAGLPQTVKAELEGLKNELKKKYENTKV